MRAILLLAAGSMGTGCGVFGPNDTEVPPGAVRMPPPAEYGAWWAKTEACSQIAGRFEDVTWYVVPGAATFIVDGEPRVGLRVQDERGIRVILAGNYADVEMVVRHEMLHALLRREGHPAEYFIARCHLTWESWAQ